MTNELNQLLKETSRSFYLTMRILPGAIRPQISLAYLLARTSDTIADTEIVPVEKRLQALAEYRDFILSGKVRLLALGQIAENQKDSAERRLLEQRELVLSLLTDFSPADQQLIRDVLKIIISGQELDLQRFAAASEKNIVALETDFELDDYTYRVAGCVGEFWTKICRAHLFSTAPWDEKFFLSHGVRFGKGLQLVNILRDLPRDLRAGRCYVPKKRLSALGLTAPDLLLPENENKLRPLYDEYLSLAESHLAAGWEYTNALPRGQFRVRLACAWPILIGARTLQKLRRENILDPARRIKVSRAEIRSLLWRSLVLYPFPSTWKKQFQSLKTTAE